MQGRTRKRFGVVAMCGVILFLTACSNNQEQAKTPPPAKGVSEQKASPPATSQAAQAEQAQEASSAAAAGGTCTAMVTSKCTACHAIARICEKIGKKSKSRWQRTVDRMIDRGAKVTPDDRTIIIDCLDTGATNDLHDACR